MPLPHTITYVGVPLDELVELERDEASHEGGRCSYSRDNTTSNTLYFNNSLFFFIKDLKMQVKRGRCSYSRDNTTRNRYAILKHFINLYFFGV